MIYKRAVAKLRAQDWSAILIELGIVILGVYIGTWVANRNQQSAERADTIRLLGQIRPEIQYQAGQFARIETYMHTTGDYATIAFAGWRRDPRVSDNDFVIAAYQASQSTGMATNSSWATIFGSNEVKNIQDVVLRDRLVRVITLDPSLTDYHQTETDYRKHVRETIPDPVQDAIRARCDDVYPAGGLSMPTLPRTCGVVLAPDVAAAAAAALRGRPELVRELNWHRAAVVSMLVNFGGYIRTLQALDEAIVGNRMGRQPQ